MESNNTKLTSSCKELLFMNVLPKPGFGYTSLDEVEYYGGTVALP